MSELKYLNIIKGMKCYKEIMRDFASKKTSHAYMLLGEDDEVANELAHLIACGVFCQSVPPCGVCRNCQNVFKDVHADLKTFPQNDEVMKVDDVESLIGSAYLKSVESDNKVYILKNVSKMQPVAQNKLLKILEEPPNGVMFILLAHNAQTVLTTIKSRTVQIEVERIDEETIAKYLVEKFGSSDKAKALAAVSDGIISLAERMMSDDEYYEIYEDMFKLLIGFDHSSKILERINLLLRHDKKFEDALSFLQIALRDALMYKTNRKLIKNFEKQEEIKQISQTFPQAALICAIELADEAKKRLTFNCGKKAIVDNLLISILEERRKCLI